VHGKKEKNLIGGNNVRRIRKYDRPFCKNAHGNTGKATQNIQG
jgi:hypothetical protein